jgi:hypothetical protein
VEIEIEPWEVTGPGLLIRTGSDKTLLHFPDPIRATVTTGSHTIRLVVTIDQATLRPVVDEAHITRRPGGRPVHGDALRGLHRVLKQIAERTVSRWVLSDDGKTWYLDQDETPKHEAGLAFKPTGKRAIPFGEVEQAAAAYRQAVAEGRRDATMAVADALGRSRTTAARRIAKARDAGLLGAPLRTRAGEGKTP